jgi:hypothetical protein
MALPGHRNYLGAKKWCALINVNVEWLKICEMCYATGLYYTRYTYICICINVRFTNVTGQLNRQQKAKNISSIPRLYTVTGFSRSVKFYKFGEKSDAVYDKGAYKTFLTTLSHFSIWPLLKSISVCLQVYISSILWQHFVKCKYSLDGLHANQTIDCGQHL